jgi:hypothetical protein
MKTKRPIEKIPTYSDFSPAAVNKALIDKSLSHWSMRYSVPLLLGTGLFGVVFGFSYNLFLVSLGIVGVTGAYFINNVFIKADKFRSQYTNYMLERMEDLKKEKLKDLHENLTASKNERGARQLQQFKQKFETLSDIIRTKFDPGQLTFDRYYSIAHEVYLSGLDNLNDVVVAEKTLKSIDLNYIGNRLKALENEEKTMASVKELEALNRSKQSFHEQKEKIKLLLAENETALSQMDTATIAISEITKSKDKQGQIDMENSMKALTEVIERSKYYSR